MIERFPPPAGFESGITILAGKHTERERERERENNYIKNCILLLVNIVFSMTQVIAVDSWIYYQASSVVNIRPTSIYNNVVS